jgi:hypothetical protein
MICLKVVVALVVMEPLVQQVLRVVKVLLEALVLRA